MPSEEEVTKDREERAGHARGEEIWFPLSSLLHRVLELYISKRAPRLVTYLCGGIDG